MGFNSGFKVLTGTVAAGCSVFLLLQVLEDACSQPSVPGHTDDAPQRLSYDSNLNKARAVVKSVRTHALTHISRTQLHAHN